MKEGPGASEDQESCQPSVRTGTFGLSERGAPSQFRERLIRRIFSVSAISAVIAVFFILVFLLRDGYQIFLEVGPAQFIFGTFWNPTGSPPSFGTFPLIVGTFLVMIGAMILSVPLSLGSAIYIAEVAPPKVKGVIKPAIELLAGVPSVVYGFFGLILLTDWLRVGFDLPSGSSWLAGSILLAIMALPTITSVAEDAIRSVPREYREGSLALGATHWQTIYRVLVPAALSGIAAAVILGIGRAIGETMAVLMVTGNAAIIPEPIYNVFSPIRTLTGTLGIEMGEVAFGSVHYHALFGVAVILLAITLLINLIAGFIFKRLREKEATKPSIFSLVAGRLSSRYEKSCPRPAETRVLRCYLLPACLVSVGSGLLWSLGGSQWILPLAGAVGVIALVRAGARRLSARISEVLAFSVLSLVIILVLVILGIILGEIIWNGAGALTWDFLTQSPRDLGRAGGIFPAIVGTVYLVAGAILFAFPLGIGSAVYLIEYTKETALTRFIRTGVDLLNGTPSIVFGLFGFAFLVLFLKFGVSMLAGQITLGLMILPTIIRTTEEALKCVPQSLREGSYALGATQWETIRRVVLPPALPGILTGAILSIGRAAGETAPILFTAAVFSTRFLPSSVLDPVMALPYHLFILTTTVPGGTANKYGTALVLLLTVISLYLAAILLRRHYQKTIVW
jgi:phosphate transport system permease protein